MSLNDYVKVLTKGDVDLDTSKLVKDVKFRGWLQKVFVVPETDLPQKLRAFDNESVDLKFIVHQVIDNSLKTNQNYREMNVLALGYKMKSGKYVNWISRIQLISLFNLYFQEGSKGASIRNFPDIECQFVNTSHAYIYKGGWKVLADNTGLYFEKYVMIIDQVME